HELTPQHHRSSFEDKVGNEGGGLVVAEVVVLAPQHGEEQLEELQCLHNHTTHTSQSHISQAQASQSSIRQTPTITCRINSLQPITQCCLRHNSVVLFV